MSRVHQRGPADVRANITPMIDVTFLLIVFFVVVSQIVELDAVRLDLPKPPDPATAPPDDGRRVTINVLPGEGDEARGYRIGERTFELGESGRAAMTAALVEHYTQSPGLRVNLRADRRTAYEWIDPVIESVRMAGSQAGVEQPPRVNLVVLRR